LRYEFFHEQLGRIYFKTVRPYELAYETAGSLTIFFTANVLLKLCEVLCKIVPHLHQPAPDIGQVVKVQRPGLTVGKLGATYRENFAANDARLDLAAGVDANDATAMENGVVIVAAGS
tara:strand:+ start:100 stop:453 length:354 start_codon:yes stop_codon:yes gene_type:complete